MFTGVGEFGRERLPETIYLMQERRQTMISLINDDKPDICANEKLCASEFVLCSKRDTCTRGNYDREQYDRW